MKNRVFLVFTALIFIMTSCSLHSDSSLKRKDLFSIKYGTFENEINLFDISEIGDISTYIQMESGLYFVCNGDSRKILEFTSYGDLIGLYYNENFTNMTKPVAVDENAKVSTQKIVSYPFNKLGKFVVDSNRGIYVVEELDVERQELDEKNNVLLKNVIHYFDPNGKFLYYLGQQGIGGSPFSHIDNIYTTSNDEFVVVSQLLKGKLISWFSKNGMTKYSINIKDDNLPVSDASLFPTLDAVFPDMNEQKIYLKIDYYKSEVDEMSKIQTGITYYETLLHPFNLETEAFENPVKVPSFDDVVKNDYEEFSFSLPYSFLGMTESGWAFFCFPYQDGIAVQTVQIKTGNAIKRNLEIPKEYVNYNTFCLSKDGVISALLAGNSEAAIVSWRTDSLVNSLLK